MLYVSGENLLQGQQETRTTGYGILDSGNQPSAKSVYGIFGESLWDSRYRLQDEEHKFTETISSLKDEQLKYKKQFTSIKGEQQNHADLKVLGTKSATKDKRTVIQEERTIRDRVEEFIRINQTEQKHKYRTRLQINSDFFKSFGEISFSAHRQGQNQEPAYYTVLKGNTDPDHAFKFLTQVWRIPPPKVLLSILGGAKTLVLKNKDIQKIKKGLLKATSSTGAWIVTGGTHSGVMKIVGEAVQEHMSKDNKGNIIVPLGIAPLGKIRGNNELSGNITTERGEMSSSNNLTDRSTGVPLDPNHSHFVFVDTENSSFGSETEFRFSLEKQISKFKFYQNRASPPEGINIPVVKIIIGGGLRTLKAVKISLEDLIPVLVIDGSGRAANFIARATELYESDLVTKKLKEFATKAFGATGVKEAMDHLHDIMKTSNKSLIRVFSLEETKFIHSEVSTNMFVFLCVCLKIITSK